MKFLIVALFIASAFAAENYDGPEYYPIDWSRVIYAHEAPDFINNDFFPHKTAGRNSRIVGGEIVEPNSHPYQVALLHQRQIFSALCGGSVITSRTILTAAHCPINSVSTTVISGVHNMNQIEATQQRRTVQAADYRLHEAYNSQTLNNDIATLRITGDPLVFNQFVQPIPLARGTDQFVGVRGISTGFGRVADGGTTSPEMRWVENTIISNDACAAVFGTTVVNDAVLCIDTTGGRGTCQGDSGGVLSVANGSGRLQVGITSFGSSAGCEQGFPAGFERVSAQISWIDANTLN